MQITTVKEDISISYLSAICAQAGIAYEIIRHDDDSTDGLMMKRIHLDKKRKFDAQLRIQLKCTSSLSQYQDHGETITYKLKVKNYNDLCTLSTTPIILGLLVLPENKNEWLQWTTEELLIKGCMYWSEFSKNKRSANSGSVTITINKGQTLHSESLNELLEKIAREDWP